MFSWVKIYLADSFANRGNLELAVQYNPHVDIYRGELALQYLENGERNKAIKEAETACRLNKFNADDFRVLAIVYGELGEEYFSKTIEAHEIASQLDPTSPTIYLEKANFLIKMQRKEEAKIALEKSLELKPNYLEARSALDSL